MLSKKLTPLILSCASFFLFTQNHILLAHAASYDGDRLAETLQSSTGLTTTVSNRDDLSDTHDRVNADHVPAQKLLTTDASNISTQNYYNGISKDARTAAFSAQNLAESINPIVSGTFKISFLLTPSDLIALRNTAAQVEQDGRTLRIIHGTRKTIRLLSEMDPHSHVVQAHTHCTPAPIHHPNHPEKPRDFKKTGLLSSGNRHKS